MTDLEKSIFSTIAWFDIFDYPLTAWEIWKWGCHGKANISVRGESFPDEEMGVSAGKNQISKIKEILEKSGKLKESISHKNGFYFLRWRDDLIEVRKERYLLAEKKYRKLLKIAKILAHLPFVKSIAVADGLSYSNSKKEDDIDLFIITAKNRIWLVRFLSILVLKLFRARPTLANKKDKICLSFFISEEALNLNRIMLPEKGGLPDVYFIYWLAWLYPIYDEGIWQKFIEANSWIRNHLPNYFSQEPILRRKIVLKPIGRFSKRFCEKIHLGVFNDLSEKFHRWLQMKLMPQCLKKLANKTTAVIISDQILKFHDKDKREIYREKFYEKIKQIN